MHKALIDTNVLLPYFLRSYDIDEPKLSKFSDSFDDLEIDRLIIHTSIFEETGNLLKTAKGSILAKDIMSNIFEEPFEFVESNQADRKKSLELLKQHPAKETDKGFKGIGVADSLFILSALQISKNIQFEKFSILTFDKDLVTALNSNIIGLGTHIITHPELYNNRSRN